MNDIHPTAIVSPEAELGDNITVGPWTIIEADVVVGDNCRIGPSVLLAAGARLGRGVQIHEGAVIGTLPQDLKFGGETTTAEIGDETIIREYATVNRGTAYRHKTVVGAHCFIMAYAHVAHDCVLGDHVIMANTVQLGGHVEIDDYAIIGGVVPVHQFTKIGAHAMIGGGFRVVQDVCPYALAGGYPLRIAGLNAIGLKRRGFSKEVIRTLQRTFKIL
ncbi:MAG: acyl-ACP--UDP-N-acetylglucosamine O-acyltransferase, partial [Candidatus Zixiibacteriota bacterium]